MSLVSSQIYKQFITTSVESAIRDLFNCLDRDHNGQLDSDDFTGVFDFPDFIGQTQVTWIRLIERFDFNNDGIIEFEEFIHGLIVQTLASEAPGDITDETLKCRFEMWIINFNTAIVEKIRHLNSNLNATLQQVWNLNIRI